MQVRAFTEADRPALRELFERAGEGSPTESLWGHPESEAAIYLTPYMDLEPESLLLAVVGGEPVGYLAGSLGSAVPSEEKRIEQAIREYRLLLRPTVVRFFARSLSDLARAKLRRQPTAGVTAPGVQQRGTGRVHAPDRSARAPPSWPQRSHLQSMTKA